MEQRQFVHFQTTTLTDSMVFSWDDPATGLEKSNCAVQKGEAFRQPAKRLMAGNDKVSLKNAAQGGCDDHRDIFRPILGLEHGNDSGKPSEGNRIKINLGVKLLGAQIAKRRRYGPASPRRNQTVDRLIAVQFHPAAWLQFQPGQMGGDLAAHQLAAIISQERQRVQRIKAVRRAIKIAMRHHKNKRVAQQRQFGNCGWQIQRSGGNANIKLAVGNAFQDDVAGCGLQRYIALLQKPRQADGQLRGNFCIEIINDSKPQTAQAGDIHHGQGDRSAPQLGQAVTHMRKVKVSRTGQAQRPMSVIYQYLPKRCFKVFQLLRRCGGAEIQISGGSLQAAGAGDFLENLKAAQRNCFAKALRQDNHFWLECILGQDASNNRGTPFMTDVFRKSFTQQEPISETAIARAADVMRSGRLHRYNVAAGEDGPVAEFERAFADWLAVPFALALSSGGQALQIALRAAGVKPGDGVLTNGFTLAPVPGAIAAVGARPLLVETNENLRPDLDDLDAKAASGAARVLMLSNMRGHLPDMHAVQSICSRHGLLLIEDCAHTMGAAWNGQQSGTFGIAGCFSTQTYKHMNSGEGGILTSADPAFMARATVLSGSYMLFGRHGAGPDDSFYEDARYDMPNCSARMDAIRATLLLDQIGTLQSRISRWNDRYRCVEDALASVSGLTLPRRPNEESYVGSSIQFLVPKAWTTQNCTDFIVATAARGVEVKWFGAAEPKGFTSRYDSWHYANPTPLPATDAVLARLFDMRLPLTFDLEDCRLISKIIADEFQREHQSLVQKGVA